MDASRMNSSKSSSLPVDGRIFNTMLLIVREIDPLLYGAILCHSLLKQQDKDMFTPLFDADEILSDDEKVENISAFVKKAVLEDSIISLLLAIKLVLASTSTS